MERTSEMGSNGGSDERTSEGQRGDEGGVPVVPADDLARMVDALRGGDLSFVFTVAVRLGAAIAAHPAAPAQQADRFVQDVVLTLADLAVAPGAGARSADELLAAAIACHTPSTEWVPETFAV